MPRRRRCRRWTTRRGAFLALFGVVYLLLGHSTLDTHLSSLDEHVFRFGLAIAPLAFWGWAWIACGIIAITDALVTRGGRDTIGFAAASLMPTAWAIIYAAAWAGNGRPETLAETTLLYAAVAGAVIVVAGMPDPSTVRRAIRAMERQQ